VGIEELQRHPTPGFDQIPSKLIKAGVRTIRFEIHKLTSLLSKLFYSSTDAQMNCLKNSFKVYIKIYIKAALTSFDAVTPS